MKLLTFAFIFLYNFSFASFYVPIDSLNVGDTVFAYIDQNPTFSNKYYYQYEALSKKIVIGKVVNNDTVTYTILFKLNVTFTGYSCSIINTDTTYILKVNKKNKLNYDYEVKYNVPNKALISQWFIKEPFKINSPYRSGIDSASYILKYCYKSPSRNLVSGYVPNLSYKYYCTTTDVKPQKTHNTFFIYPNPNNGIFIINSFLNVTAKLYDSSGSKIVDLDIITGDNYFNLGLKSGLYLLHFGNKIEKILIF